MNIVINVFCHIIGRILSTEIMFNILLIPVLLIINLIINYLVFGFKNKNLYLLNLYEIIISILYYFCVDYIMDDKHQLDILIFLIVLLFFILYIYMYSFLLSEIGKNKISIIIIHQILFFLLLLIFSSSIYTWYSLERFKQSITASIFMTFIITLTLWNIRISYNFLQNKYIKYLIYVTNIIFLILPTIILPILLEIGMILG